MSIDPSFFHHSIRGLTVHNLFASPNSSAIALRSLCRSLILAVLIAFINIASLYADSGTWTSTTTGLWSDGANWSDSTVANGLGYTADFGTIDTTADVTVHIDSARTIGNLTFGDTLTSSAAGWTLGNNGNSANILTLSGGTPTITVNQLGTGKTATIGLEIAGTAGLTKMGVGTLVLSGANSYTGTTTISAGTLAYGANDVISTSGVLVDGGILSMGSYSGSVGTVTVDGGGSITGSGTLSSTGNLYIGKNGSGTLDITSGGTLKNTSSSGYIGYNSGSTGVVKIDGTDSRWTSYRSLYVGHEGNGTLTLTNGGTLWADNSGVTVGFASNSVGVMTVDGTNASSVVVNALGVGDEGDGTLNISKGGVVSTNTYGYIGISSGSTGKATVTNPNSKWTNHSKFYVGYSGDGTLDISDSGVVENTSGYVGYSSGSMGEVTVANAGSQWINSRELSVGHSGTGTLNISDSGTVSNTSGYIGYSSGSVGEVTVVGAGSRWTNSSLGYSDLYVGLDGSGILNIDDHGEVLVNGTTYVAYNPGSSGKINFDNGSLTTYMLRALSANLTGTGTINTGGFVGDVDIVFDSTSSSTFTLHDQPDQNITVNLNLDYPWGDVGVGDQGNGSLTVCNGATIKSQNGYLGNAVNSVGVARIEDTSNWTNSQQLYVGREGHGILEIVGGAKVSNFDGYIANTVGSTGNVLISGADSSWQNADLYVGNGGNGMLSIEDGGTVSNHDGTIGVNSGANGVVTIRGAQSTWNINHILRVGYSGDGTLNVGNGGTVASYSSNIGSNSGSTGEVTVGGAGSKWTISAGLSIGNVSTGTLNITDGGTVATHYNCSIGSSSGSTGIVKVAGAESTWQNDSAIFVGNEGDGELSVTGGGAVSNTRGYIGFSSNAIGVATVTGTDSLWSNSQLYVGYRGNGTLNITDDGSVIVGGATHIASGAGSSGKIAFNDGTLTTRSLYALSSQLAGTGTVYARGLVSDIDLVFDEVHALQQTLFINSQVGQDITVNLDLGNPSTNGDLGIGWKDNCSLTICDGIQVNSQLGYVGYSASMAQATVSGAGSKWINSEDLYIGISGNGMLHINDGAAVSNDDAFIGYGSGSTGIVGVSGAGSKWTNDNLYIGREGNGVLNIANGGTVSAFHSYVGYGTSTGMVTVNGAGSRWTGGYLDIGPWSTSGSGIVSITAGGAVAMNEVSVQTNSQSLLAIDVGNGSSLTVENGTGSISNNGIVRIIAGAKPPANTAYSPISAGTWNGSGTYQAVGGKWNTATHVFTVSDMVPGTSAQQVAIDLTTKQRILVDDIGDGKTGWSVGASFLEASSSTPLTFTATAISGITLSDLETLAVGQSVLSGWEFLADNYIVSSANPVYLSLMVGSGWSTDDFDLWHYATETGWETYTAADLTYDGTYASFTTTSFSGYAVSAVVPEPSSLILFGIGVFGLFAYFGRRRKWTL